MKIFITGERGIGKSTVANKIAELLNKPRFGFVTVRVHDGFDIMDLENGDTEPIARRNKSGEFDIFLDGFEELGLRALDKALANENCIAFMDELGRFEQGAINFKKKVVEIILSSKPVIAVVKYESNPFLYMVSKIASAHLFKVTEKNRDNLAYEILDFVGRDPLVL